MKLKLTIILIFFLGHIGFSDAMGQSEVFIQDSLHSELRATSQLDSLKVKLDSLDNLNKAALLVPRDSIAAIRGDVEELVKRINDRKKKELEKLDSLALISSSSIQNEISDIVPESKARIDKQISDDLHRTVKDSNKTLRAVSSEFEIPHSTPLDKASVKVEEVETLGGNTDAEKEINELIDVKGFEALNGVDSLPQLDSLSKEKVISTIGEKAENKAEEEASKALKGLGDESAYFNPSKVDGLKQKSKYFQNKEDVAKEIAERFKALGYDNTTSFQDKLKESQDKLAKYKRKYSDISSIDDLDMKPKNPMKEKSLKERLVWGGNFQVHKKVPYGVDLRPQLSFKLTRLFSTGVGGTYRISINADKNGVNTKENIYGSSVFLDYEFYRGFALHVEYEQMRMSTPHNATVSATDNELRRHWKRSSYVGLKKRYSITKKLIGTAQVLYNFYPEKNIIKSERLVFRFGFELVPSKDKTKEEESN